MLNRIAPLVLVFIGTLVISAGCAQQNRRTAAAPAPAATTAEARHAAHAGHDDSSCACDQVQCYERVRKGCRASCSEHEHPECSCKARCTVMGRFVAQNRCECRGQEE